MYSLSKAPRNNILWEFSQISHILSEKMLKKLSSVMFVALVELK